MKTSDSIGLALAFWLLAGGHTAIAAATEGGMDAGPGAPPHQHDGGDGGRCGDRIGLGGKELGGGQVEHRLEQGQHQGETKEVDGPVFAQAPPSRHGCSPPKPGQGHFALIPCYTFIL